MFCFPLCLFCLILLFVFFFFYCVVFLIPSSLIPFHFSFSLCFNSFRLFFLFFFFVFVFFPVLSFSFLSFLCIILSLFEKAKSYPIIEESAEVCQLEKVDRFIRRPTGRIDPMIWDMGRQPEPSTVRHHCCNDFFLFWQIALLSFFLFFCYFLVWSVWRRKSSFRPNVYVLVPYTVTNWISANMNQATAGKAFLDWKLPPKCALRVPWALLTDIRPNKSTCERRNRDL